jgi:hypothetical protein
MTRVNGVIMTVHRDPAGAIHLTPVFDLQNPVATESPAIAGKIS